MSIEVTEMPEKFHKVYATDCPMIMQCIPIYPTCPTCRARTKPAIHDFGDWGNGPDDPHTQDEDMRRFYFMGNVPAAGAFRALTVYGTARVPSSWKLRQIRGHGMLQFFEDLTVSFDVLMLKHALEIVDNNE